MSRHHKLIYRQIKHCKVRDRSPGHAATINTTLWAKEISKAGGFFPRNQFHEIFREIDFTEKIMKHATFGNYFAHTSGTTYTIAVA